MKRVLVAGLLGATMLFSGGYAIGQQTAVWQSYQRKITDASVLMQLDGKVWSGAQKTSEIYTKAAKSQAFTRVVVENALVAGRSDNQEALVKLQALQVMQNQRIIELLEKKK